jgi:methylated-DNA-[protein]-cysteine S-methyltransferase
MKSCKSERVEARCCRLGRYSVTVSWRGGKVAGVALGTRRGSEDRKLARELMSVLAGGRIPARLHVDASGETPFVKKVLGRCAGIRPGQVMTYSELACAAGRPKAARAAGQVMATNPFALLVPCHRVVGSDYTLHGFGGGLAMKEWLLANEGWEFEGKGRVRRLKSEVKGPMRRGGAGKRSG